MNWNLVVSWVTSVFFPHIEHGLTWVVLKALSKFLVNTKPWYSGSDAIGFPSISMVYNVSFGFMPNVFEIACSKFSENSWRNLGNQ